MNYRTNARNLSMNFENQDIQKNVKSSMGKCKGKAKWKMKKHIWYLPCNCCSIYVPEYLNNILRKFWIKVWDWSLNPLKFQLTFEPIISFIKRHSTKSWKVIKININNSKCDVFLNDLPQKRLIKIKLFPYQPTAR